MSRRRFPLPLSTLAAMLGASLLGLAGCSKAAPPDPQDPAVLPSSRLAVEGSALVYRSADGKRVLRGVELAGRTVEMAQADGTSRPVRIESVTPDPDDPDLLRHDFRVQDGRGEWVVACAPNYYKETWGYAFASSPGASWMPTCSSGAHVKCARFGYKPWGRGPKGEDLAPYHAACVHMVRADYCGTGTPHTRDGTMIQIFDRIGIRPEPPADPEHAFEAGWAASGAVCVARTRLADVVSLEDLAAECPALKQGAACDPDTAVAAGALVLNRSRPVVVAGPAPAPVTQR